MRCQVGNNIEEIVTFTRTVADKSFKINDFLRCKVRNSITVNRFSRLRCNNYKESNKEFLTGKKIKQKSLHKHFLKNGHHGFEDVGICLIDKTNASDHHKREYYWMRTLKTIAPFGLNTEEIYCAVYTITHFSSVLLLLIFLI